MAHAFVQLRNEWPVDW